MSFRSPGAKRRKTAGTPGSSAKKGRGKKANPVIAYTIARNPNLGDDAPCLIVAGSSDYAEYLMSQMIREISTDQDAYNWVYETVNCVDNTIFCIDENGKTITKTIWDRREQCNKTYPCKYLVFDAEHDFKDAEVLAWHKELVGPTLAKASKHCDNDQVIDSRENVQHKTYFSEIFSEKSIRMICSYFYYKEPEESFASWLQSSKDVLYALWPEGQVPISVMKAYMLGEDHLHLADWERLRETLKQEAKEEEAEEKKDDEQDE